MQLEAGEAEGVEAGVKEPAGGAGVGGELAADADGDAGGACGGGDEGDGTADGGSERVVETGDGAVAAVGGHDVLGEVVGADAEEVAHGAPHPRYRPSES